MDSKPRNRRGFLKKGAALAGLALGTARSASGQTEAQATHDATHDEAASKNPKELAKELIAYGERSRFVTSVRVPVAERMSPDMFGLTFHVLTPLQDSVGIITPSSLFYVATHRGSFVPEINPSEHRLMIHGMVDRPLVFTMDELKRLPSVSRVHFIECLGNRAQAQAQDRPGNARVDQLRRMDRRAAVAVAQGGRRAERRVLDRGGRRRGSEGLVEHSAGEGAWTTAWWPTAEWRAAASSARLPAAADGSRLRRDLSDQVFAAHQGRGPLLHDLRRLRAHQSRCESGRADATRLDRNRSSPSRPADSSCPAPASTKSAAWPGPAAGAIRKVEISTDGGQSWQDAELRSPVVSNGAHPVRLRLEVGRQGVRAHVALHGRTRHGSTDASRGRQVLEQAARRQFPRPRRRQYRSTVEGRERWERAQWARVSSSWR